MKLFKPLYESAIRWAAHAQAERLLAGLSFIEAIIFPIMPEVMLGPMVLARPQRWARFATVSLVFSVLGALVGYALGYYAFELLRPLSIRSGGSNASTSRSPSCALSPSKVLGPRSGCSSWRDSCRFR